MKNGKKYNASIKAFDRAKQHDVEEAIKVVRSEERRVGKECL